MLFLPGSRLRFDRKKTLICYALFSLFLLLALCVLYVPEGGRRPENSDAHTVHSIFCFFHLYEQ